MREARRDADVVFLRLMVPQPGGEADHAVRLVELRAVFKNTFLGRNAGRHAGELIQTG